MHTVLEIIKKTTDFLAPKGVDNPRLNAEHLVGHVLGLKRMQLYLQFERPMVESELEQIRQLVRRRAQREPLQYILGSTEFFGVILKVDRRALIPRPETEHLLTLVVEKLTAAPDRLLDLGTGSGAIALALARHYAAARVEGVDLSNEALALARENAVALDLSDRVTFTQSDWFAAIAAGSRYQLIVANPPYLSAVETEATLDEVRNFEPKLALTPGETGLEALCTIIGGARDYLGPGGLLALETGTAQHVELKRRFEAAGYRRCEFAPDLTGRPRFAFAWTD
ncbi:MAG: peptide chain release factor N(5)-glutamine methyltransferase [Cephaloticoccus sp.]|nr:peptide chain release factor N(5)-glutamine methyltransferase [Cephaloticoccus sp.]MCF7761114.1 peptide chain release factor N(5)-glutamine methyltransferase [Cephaloticoccus sp.]